MYGTLSPLLGSDRRSIFDSCLSNHLLHLPFQNLEADRNLPGNFQTGNDSSRLVTGAPAELLGEDVILNTDSVLHDFRKLTLDVRFHFADIFRFEKNTQRSFQNLIFENRCLASLSRSERGLTLTTAGHPSRRTVSMPLAS